MSDVTSKQMSQKDQDQILRTAFNDNDGTISTSGFVDGKVGHRIKTQAVSSTIDESYYFDEVNTQDCDFTMGSPTVVVENTIDFEVGQYVLLDVGTDGIPDGTTVLSIDSNTQITMSANFTGATNTYTGHFANLLKRIRIRYNNASHEILLDVARVE